MPDNLETSPAATDGPSGHVDLRQKETSKSSPQLSYLCDDEANVVVAYKIVDGRYRMAVVFFQEEINEDDYFYDAEDDE